MAGEAWAAGEAYDGYVGRWSRAVARLFVPWLGVPAGQRWLDVGCGTGALTGTVLATAEPVQVVGVDRSPGFVGTARRTVTDERAGFVVGDAQTLPLPDRRFAAVVSALAINFVPDPRRAVAELARVADAGGVVAAYVWDYADGMGMLREFWDAAVALDPAAAELDEGRRFSVCRPDPLQALWGECGMADVTVRPLDVPTVFADFDDYWAPFHGGQGPAAGYAMSLTEQRRAVLRDLVRERLPAGEDGAIRLGARAWAVRGVVR